MFASSLSELYFENEEENDKKIGIDIIEPIYN
jgi:hypothetical protein